MGVKRTLGIDMVARRSRSYAFAKQDVVGCCEGENDDGREDK